MNIDNTRLFIGYFNDKTKPLNIATFLTRTAPEIEKLWVIQEVIRFNRKVCCCCIQFPSEKQMKKAWQQLYQLQRSEKKLTLRRWTRRTGANDRRDISWRSKEWPIGDRRSRERRNFQPLVFRYDYNSSQIRTLGKRQTPPEEATKVKSPQ